ncbi:MAG: hypothetical protein KA163_15215 [Bacteroidia bacterium]|nr:hypothetical protein [Bacteroidia bacterium]
MKTLRFFIVIFLFPVFAIGQTDNSKIYSQAITEYLKTVNTKDKTILDTLFVGPMDKDVDEDISEIKLPKEILKTKISKLTQEEGDRKAKYHKTFVFVNIVGIISKEHAEFMFITFMVENSGVKAAWFPQHNNYFIYKYDTKKKEFVLDKQRSEYNYSNKFTEKK